MCLVLTLLKNISLKKIQVNKNDYTYLLIHIICCLTKILLEKFSGTKTRSRKKSSTDNTLPLIITLLNYFDEIFHSCIPAFQMSIFTVPHQLTFIKMLHCWTYPDISFFCFLDMLSLWAHPNKFLIIILFMIS